MADLLTLPDYLAPGLEILFVGINPGLYSAQQGHYFARPTNRFWPAFSRSRLSAPVRAVLKRDRLTPEDDARLLDFGIGFTDVVKRATRNASELAPADYQEGAPRLLESLRHLRPRLACFHGITGYRAFSRYGLNRMDPVRDLGAQPEVVGTTALFVVPSPSPANAHFHLEDQIVWYDRLAEFVEGLKRTL